MSIDQYGWIAKMGNCNCCDCVGIEELPNWCIDDEDIKIVYDWTSSINLPTVFTQTVDGPILIDNSFPIECCYEKTFAYTKDPFSQVGKLVDSKTSPIFYSRKINFFSDSDIWGFRYINDPSVLNDVYTIWWLGDYIEGCEGTLPLPGDPPPPPFECWECPPGPNTDPDLCCPKPKIIGSNLYKIDYLSEAKIKSDLYLNVVRIRISKETIDSKLYFCVTVILETTQLIYSISKTNHKWSWDTKNFECTKEPANKSGEIIIVDNEDFSTNLFGYFFSQRHDKKFVLTKKFLELPEEFTIESLDETWLEDIDSDCHKLHFDSTEGVLPLDPVNEFCYNLEFENQDISYRVITYEEPRQDFLCDGPPVTPGSYGVGFGECGSGTTAGGVILGYFGVKTCTSPRFIRYRIEGSFNDEPFLSNGIFSAPSFWRGGALLPDCRFEYNRCSGCGPSIYVEEFYYTEYNIGRFSPPFLGHSLKDHDLQHTFIFERYHNICFQNPEIKVITCEEE